MYDEVSRNRCLECSDGQEGVRGLSFKSAGIAHSDTIRKFINV